MRDQDKNRSPERAQKRALADARCAWRKMHSNQREAFLYWVEAGSESDLCEQEIVDIASTWEEAK